MGICCRTLNTILFKNRCLTELENVFCGNFLVDELCVSSLCLNFLEVEEKFESHYLLSFPIGSSSHMNNNGNNNNIISSSAHKAHDSNSINQNFSNKPYFDLTMPRNVTLKVGETAFLSCRVKQLGDKVVSDVKFYLFPRFSFGMNYISFISCNPSDIFQSSHSFVI